MTSCSSRGCNRNIQMHFCVTSNVPAIDVKILPTWHHISSFGTKNCVLSTLTRVPENVNILRRNSFTVLTSSENPPLLHDINSATLKWKTLFTDDTTRRQTLFHAQQEALNGAPATCESAIGGTTYQLQQFGKIRN